MEFNQRVKGKVSVVTGGALGIGRACAIMLARHGSSVVVSDLLDEEGSRLVEDIARMGGKAIYVHADVSKESDVARCMEQAKSHFGPVTVLVNNAGISGTNKPTHELSEQEWDSLMSVNVKGVFFCTKHAVPQMLEAGIGSIINLSSIYGLVGAPDVPPYHASKGAVRLMSKTDALLYAKNNIRVNSVHPGFIWTPMVEHFLGSSEDPVAARGFTDSLHPLGHMGEPDDIAYGVLYLASDESKFVTGSELVIDGGYTAR